MRQYTKRFMTGALAGMLLFAVLPTPVHAQVSWASVVAYITNMLRESTIWKMLVAQTAVSSNQIAETAQKSNQQLAKALEMQRKEKLIADAITDYGAVTGQPMTAGCVAQTNARLYVASAEQADRDASKLMRNFSGSSSPLATERRSQMMKRLMDEYCTVSEARQGICKLKGNGMQAWDRNYAGAFGNQTLSPEGEVAAYDFANMVTAPSGDRPIDCTGASCDEYRLNDLGRSALSSMVASVFVGQATSRRSPMLTGE
jgi:hypothetical protein